MESQRFEPNLPPRFDRDLDPETNAWIHKRSLENFVHNFSEELDYFEEPHTERQYMDTFKVREDSTRSFIRLALEYGLISIISEFARGTYRYRISLWYQATPYCRELRKACA